MYLFIAYNWKLSPQCLLSFSLGKEAIVLFNAPHHHLLVVIECWRTLLSSSAVSCYVTGTRECLGQWLDSVRSEIDGENIEPLLYQEQYYTVLLARPPQTSWRNGSASDSRSEGCVFKSRRGHTFYSSTTQKFTVVCLPAHLLEKTNQTWHGYSELHSIPLVSLLCLSQTFLKLLISQPRGFFDKP